MQDEMLPPEHMERMHKLLLLQQGKVSWLALHAGHMDAYETASEVAHSCLPIDRSETCQMSECLYSGSLQVEAVQQCPDACVAMLAFRLELASGYCSAC